MPRTAINQALFNLGIPTVKETPDGWHHTRYYHAVSEGMFGPSTTKAKVLWEADGCPTIQEFNDPLFMEP